MAGIKLVQGSTTYNVVGASHPAPIALDRDVLCYLSFVGSPVPILYHWFLTGTLTGSHSVISSASSAAPSFTPDMDAWTGTITLVDENQNTYVLDIVNASDPVISASTANGLSPMSYGAIGNGIADDTAAIQAAVNAAIVTNIGQVIFPAGRYRYTATISVPAAVKFTGPGGIPGGISALSTRFPVLLHDFNGTGFLFDGDLGDPATGNPIGYIQGAGSGGGFFGLRLVQIYRSSASQTQTTPSGSGQGACIVIGVSATNGYQAQWVHTENCIIEQVSGGDPWTFGKVYDSTNYTGSSNFMMNFAKMHLGAGATAAIKVISVSSLKMFGNELHDSQAHIVVTGTGDFSGSAAQSLPRSNGVQIIGGDGQNIDIQYAERVAIVGGDWKQIVEDTSKVGILNCYQPSYVDNDTVTTGPNSGAWWFSGYFHDRYGDDPTWTVVAATNVITFVAPASNPDFSIANHDLVFLSSSGSLPTVSGTALSPNTGYYLRNVSGLTAKIAYVDGAAEVDFTGTGTGIHTAVKKTGAWRTDKPIALPPYVAITGRNGTTRHDLISYNPSLGAVQIAGGINGSSRIPNQNIVTIGGALDGTGAIGAMGAAATAGSVIMSFDKRLMWMKEDGAAALRVLELITGNVCRLGIDATATTINGGATEGLRVTATKISMGSTTMDVEIDVPLVALGAGGAATLGLTGGSGPATTTQYKWLRLKDSTGDPFWVPVWK